MDAVEAKNDFHDDWELLQPNSDPDSAPVGFHPLKSSFDEMNTGSLLHPNYFSLDARKEDSDYAKSPILDDTTWIHPGFDENPNRCLDNESGEFQPVAGSERSEDEKFIPLEAPNELGIPGNMPEEVSSQGIGEIFEEKVEKAGNYPGSDGFVEASAKVNLRGEEEVLGEERNDYEKIVSVGKGIGDSGNKITGELGKRNMVWWKMPMEVIKCCVFRMNPVLTVSVAAAVMGIAILSRRLYRTKKKTRGLEIKVSVDDEKISRTMSRAARLNEAFSVVKRVPVIRTSLTASGVATSWPVMSSR